MTSLNIHQSAETSRLPVTCPHQSGVLYFVPGERSWVCSPEQLPAHALAGFFKGLLALQDPRVKDLMQLWGIYFRELPLEVSQLPKEEKHETTT